MMFFLDFPQTILELLTLETEQLKMGLFRNNRELQFGTCKLSKKHRQVRKIMDRTILL